MNEDDWMNRIRSTADRLREAADTLPESSPDQKPPTVKRPYQTPSGANTRSINTKNAYTRIQNKKGIR